MESCCSHRGLDESALKLSRSRYPSSEQALEPRPLYGRPVRVIADLGEEDFAGSALVISTRVGRLKRQLPLQHPCPQMGVVSDATELATSVQAKTRWERCSNTEAEASGPPV